MTKLTSGVTGLVMLLAMSVGAFAQQECSKASSDCKGGTSCPRKQPAAKK